MKFCKFVELPEIADPRGKLMFAEDGRHIPFDIKRIFAIYGVPAGHGRGAHAHRAHHQFIIMMAGSCTISINEGAGITQQLLDRPSSGLYVPPLVWIELTDFSSDAACLVLTSDHFDEADYVRNLDEYQRLVADRTAAGPGHLQSPG